MRVSLINLNLIAQDAIGQCLLNQVRFFQRRGDEVQVYVMHPPQGVPESVAALTRVVTLADLDGPRDERFFDSDLYVYHYPGRHPLMESIKCIDRGAVVFYYHNVTPPELWHSDFEREVLQGSVEGVSALAYYADLIVADSAFNADQLIEEYDCERDRVRVLPLAVPLDQFTSGPRDLTLLQQVGLEGRRVILFVGRMAGNKRIDLLVEALPLVQQQVPNASLMLVGDDRSNPAIQDTVARARARSEELGVADDVIFTGRVDDVPPYYRLVDVYVTASLHEGFGVPLIEAMASGVPVVASRAAAHPWVVGEAGMLAEPGDAVDLANKVVQLLSDDALYGELVRRGLARAREFSLERYEAGWAKIVAEATAWLPNQPYPRLRSVLAKPAVSDVEAKDDGPVSTVQQVLLKGDLGRLEASADVMLRDYTVRSGLPVVGPLIAWFRRNLTSHLREPYVDPTFERQVAFNQEMIQVVGQAMAYMLAHSGVQEDTLQDSVQRQRELGHRMERVEAWLGLVSAQITLLEAGGSNQPDSAQLAELCQRIEELRQALAPQDEQTA